MKMAAAGRPIRAVLEERGIQSKWLAKQLGLSRPYLSQIIGGTRKAPPLFYERVAGILNVPIDRVRPEQQREQGAA